MHVQTGLRLCSLPSFEHVSILSSSSAVERGVCLHDQMCSDSSGLFVSMSLSILVHVGLHADPDSQFVTAGGPEDECKGRASG